MEVQAPGIWPPTYDARELAEQIKKLAGTPDFDSEFYKVDARADDFSCRAGFSFGRPPSGPGMNAAQILAQLASDVELGEGSHTGDHQMTVGAFERDVFIEVGPLACTLSSSDALGIAAWLGRDLGCMEWEGVLGTVTCRIVGLDQGEVQVELMGEDEPDVDAIWHGSADQVRQAIGRSLLLARTW